MKTAQLIRNYSEDWGTQGLFWTDDFKCHMLELPWLDNERNISCIPANNEYEVIPHVSPKFGEVYKVLNVRDRSDILIHAGNYAGNTDFGLKTDSQGCLMPCMAIGEMNGQMAGLSSRQALSALKKAMGYASFKLKIIWQEYI